MKLDEAIKHAEEVASRCEKHSKYRKYNADRTNDEYVINNPNTNGEYEAKCGEEHRQLAEWLKDYKRLKEQEPKTGHWIGQKKNRNRLWKDCIVPLKDGFVTDSCSCSECGEWLTASDEYLCYGNYCPNCGAKMESEVDKG